MGRRDRRARTSDRFGVLLVDKPLGPTSHDLVGWARWALRERGIGHCGTLDPAASGMMVLCVGGATKLVEHLSAVDKRYRARFVLGASTTTADAQGELVDEAPVSAEVEAKVESTARSLVGELELPPPIYSALKLQGRRAHELARAGELESLPPRPMAVRSLEWHGQGREGERVWAELSLEVAKGTYVRSLAEELGRRLGVPGHMSALHREACDRLSLDHPNTVKGLTARPLETREGAPPKWRVDFADADPEAEDRRERAGARLEQALVDPWTLLPFPVGELTQGPGSVLVERLAQGQRLAASEPNLAALGLEAMQGRGVLSTCAVVEPHAGRMIILERDESRLAPRRVLRFAARQAPSS